MTIENVATVELEIEDLDIDELQVEEWEDQYLLENRSLDGFEQWLKEEKLPQWARHYITEAQGHNDLHYMISVGEVHIHD